MPLLSFCTSWKHQKTRGLKAVAQTCSIKRCSYKFRSIHRETPATLFKKRLWHRRFRVNFAKFLRTPFLQNTFRDHCFCKSFIENYHLLTFYTPIDCQIYFFGLSGYDLTTRVYWSTHKKSLTSYIIQVKSQLKLHFV